MRAANRSSVAKPHATMFAAETGAGSRTATQQPPTSSAVVGQQQRRGEATSDGGGASGGGSSSAGAEQASARELRRVELSRRAGVGVEMAFA